MKIVLVDDEEVNLTFTARVLQDYEVFTFKDPKKALQFCNTTDFDLLLSDMRMPGMTGLALIKEIRKKKTDFTSIIVSAYTDADYLMESVNANILFHYLVKPCDPPTLQETVAAALRHLQLARDKRTEEKRLTEQTKKLQEENIQLRFHANSPLESIVGFNPAILKLKEQIKSFALSDHPVFITGEEGTGKKLVAEVIHQMSSRQDKPYKAFSCSTIPSDLHESELFGAAKNSATGMKQPKTGFIEDAEEGTLFIEDIQELSKPLQSKLLKFLQYGNFYPVGSTEEKTADVRIICSSRTTLLKEVEDGSFRKELYYKIANLQIKTPPLRERREDILAVMESIAKNSGKQLPSIGAKEKDTLTRYAFPGNIRELEGILEKINLNVRSSQTQTIGTEEIESILKENAQIYAIDQGEHAVVKTIQLPTGQEVFNMREFIDGIEKEIILASLRCCDNNISQTARNLMISRQGLKNKIKRYEIPVEDDEEEEPSK